MDVFISINFIDLRTFPYRNPLHRSADWLTFTLFSFPTSIKSKLKAEPLDQILIHMRVTLPLFVQFLIYHYFKLKNQSPDQTLILMRVIVPLFVQFLIYYY